MTEELTKRVEARESGQMMTTKTAMTMILRTVCLCWATTESLKRRERLVEKKRRMNRRKRTKWTRKM